MFRAKSQTNIRQPGFELTTYSTPSKSRYLWGKRGYTGPACVFRKLFWLFFINVIHVISLTYLCSVEMFVNYLGFCLFQWMCIKSFKGLEPITKFYTTSVRTLTAPRAGGVFVKASTFCLCRLTSQKRLKGFYSQKIQQTWPQFVKVLTLSFRAGDVWQDSWGGLSSQHSA